MVYNNIYINTKNEKKDNRLHIAKIIINQNNHNCNNTKIRAKN